MVLWLVTGCGGLGFAAGYWAYCGTGHDYLRVMDLKLITSVKTIGCTMKLGALKPRMFRIFHFNVGTEMYFALMSAQGNQ